MTPARRIEEKLGEAVRLAEEATPGPWYDGINYWAVPIPCVTCGDKDKPLLVAEIGVLDGCAPQATENAAFIAHCNPAFVLELARDWTLKTELLNDLLTGARYDGATKQRILAALADPAAEAGE